MKFNIGDRAYYQNRECVVVALYEESAVVRLPISSYYEDYDGDAYERVDPLDQVIEVSDLTPKKVDMLASDKAIKAKLVEDIKLLRLDKKKLSNEIVDLRSQVSKLIGNEEKTKNCHDLLSYLIGNEKHKYAIYFHRDEWEEDDISIQRLTDRLSYSLTVRYNRSTNRIEVKCNGSDVIVAETKKEAVQLFRERIMARDHPLVYSSEIRFCEKHGLADLIERSKKYVKEEHKKKAALEVERAKERLEDAISQAAKYEKGSK